jgi:hypothetical protein
MLRFIILHLGNKKQQDSDKVGMEKQKADYAKAFYAPYHCSARRPFRTLEKKFSIPLVYKQTETLGNHFFKRSPKLDTQFLAKYIHTSTLGVQRGN